MLESVKKLSHCLVAALSLSMVLFGSAANAKGTPGSPTLRPYLCQTSDDGSEVGFVNVKNSSIILVRLVGSDSGGAMIQHLTPSSPSTSEFSVDVMPTASTSNLQLQLVVALTNGKNQTSVTVNPTNVVTKGGVVTCTFNFKQYGWSSALNITGVVVQVSLAGDSDGALYLYKYAFNNTAITDKIPSQAGCL